MTIIMLPHNLLNFFLKIYIKPDLTILSSRDIDVKSSHGTAVIFLQNDAGFNRWAPTSDRISELRLAYVRRDSIYSS